MRAPTSSQVSQASVDATLHYGYDPDCWRAGLPEPVLAAAGSETHAGRHDALVEAGRAAFRTALDAELSAGGADGTHVVPLSGGLDSRAVLGGLLAHPDLDREQIRAVTFGSPGTWDFEIGTRVAQAAGVPVTTIDLTGDSFDWSPAAIRAYARTRDCPGGVLDGYVNAVASAVGGEDATVWSGFMGDPSAGGHQPAEPRETWSAACEHFAADERRADGLASPGFDPRSVLPDEPYLPRQRLSYEEQLDFAHRQQCLVAPTVLASADDRTPFCRRAWLAYSLNLPRRLRRDRALFVDVFASAFPDLFELPTDARAGYPPNAGTILPTLRRARILATERAASLLGVPYTHPATNYLDFEAAFRTGELRPIATEAVQALGERPTADWLDPEAIWRDHLAGADRTDEIIVVLALELYLSESLG